jgi:predicted unusual protein kinase regulating ubiquinone biosynthesis (AarF/ABC1/UbiB family)
MMNKSVPTGKLARTGIAGAALMKAGGKHLAHAAIKPFLSDLARNNKKEMLDEHTARLMFTTLAQLRGTALKIAQMLSMETSLLPESYRQELAKSYHQAPPLGRPLVRKVIRQAFGKSPEELFTRFETQAFAAASLGQVHRAQNGNGDHLAVKIQYPGIKTTIKNDLQLVRSVVKRTKFAPLILSGLEEIELRLSEEVNYEHEAENTEWFRQNLQLKNIKIPRIYRKYSTNTVLTTSKLQGLHLDQWLQQNPSQKSRNHFGQLLYDSFVHSFYGLHALHADPNPGNYLFADDGTLGLIDFGCIRHFSADFVHTIPKLLRAYLDDDAEAVIKTYEKLGIVGDIPAEELDTFYDKTLRPFGDWMTKPLKSKTFSFSNHNASLTTEALNFIHEFTKVKHINKRANEFIFFDRTFFGLYQIFERLNATIKMQHQWLR